MTTNRFTVRSGVTVTLALALLAGLFSLAFAGWVDHGSSILLTMAETGLSWCF